MPWFLDIRPAAGHMLLRSNLGHRKDAGTVQIIIAMVLGIVIAVAGAAVLVHDATSIPKTSAGQLYSYGST